MDLLQPFVNTTETLLDDVSGAMEALGLKPTEPVNPNDNQGDVTTDVVEIEPAKPSITTAANSVIMAEAGAVGGVSVLGQKPGDVKISQGFEYSTGTLNQCKLFELKEFEYTTSNTDFTLIDTITLPKDYYSVLQNPSHGNSRYFQYVRTRFILQFQVNAPLGASGGILFTYEPRWRNTQYQRGTLWNFPHVVLDIARTTTATLHVPFSSCNNYVSIDSDEQGYVCAYSLGELGAGSGTDAALYVAVFISALDNELQNPRPPQQMKVIQIGNTPGSICLGNYAHTLNVPTLAVANEVAVYDSQTPGLGAPLDSIKWLMNRPSMVDNGFLYWQDLHERNHLLFEEDVYLGNIPNLRMLADTFMYFRGSLRLHVMVLSSGAHRGRLRLCFFPNLTHGQRFTAEESRNSIFSIVDIASTNFGTLIVPYAAKTWMRLTTDLLGRFQIFVNNQLTKNTTASNRVRMYVLCSLGEDAEFYSPRDSGVVYQGPPPAPGAVDTLEHVPDASAPSNAVIADPGNFTRSHMDISVFFGRAWYVNQFTPVQGINHVAIPFPASGHGAVARSMAYFSGELVITIMNATDQVLEVTHTWDEIIDTEAKITSHGSIVVPVDGVTSFRSPYYSKYAVRSVMWEHSLGRLIVAAHGDTPRGQVEVRVAMRKPNFYLPVALPSAAKNFNVESVRHWMLPPRMVDFSDDIPRLKPSAPVFDPVRARMNQFLFNRPAQQGWVRDLTNDGDIESNPGPAYLLVSPDGRSHYLQVYDLCFQIATKKSYNCFKPKPVKVYIQRAKPISGSVVIGAAWDSECINELRHMRVTGVKYQLTAEAQEDIDALFPLLGQGWVSGPQSIYFLYLALSAKWAVGSDRPVYVQPRYAQEVTVHPAHIHQQGPLDLIHVLLQTLDNKVLSMSLSAYAPLFIRSVVYLLCMYKTHDPAITLLLGAMMAYDVATMKPPPAIAILTEAIAATSFESLSRIFSSLFVHGRIPRALGNMMRRLTSRLTFQHNSFLNFTRIVQSVIFWIKGIMKCVEYICKLRDQDSCHEANVEELARLYTLADSVYTSFSLPLTERPNRDKERREVLQKLMYVSPYISRFGAEFSQRHSRAIDRLTRLKPAADPLPVIRTEPLGIWICGPPGMGKSLLMTKLAMDLAEGGGVYYHPGNDKYYSGYNGQRVHCFDDLGQNKAEEDLACLCQCISSCPFLVSGAAVEDKGTPYTSEYVIATTNRTGFSTYTLTTPGALERRFPVRIMLKEKLNHQTLQSGDFQVQLDGKDISYVDLLKYLRDTMSKRHANTQIMEQGPSAEDNHDEDEVEVSAVKLNLFPEETLKDSVLFSSDDVLSAPPAKSSYIRYFSAAIDSVRNLVNNQTVQNLFSILGATAAAIVTIRKLADMLVGVASAVGKLFANNAPQGPYNPTPHAKRIDPADFARRHVSQQGPSISGLRHLFKYCGYVQYDDLHIFILAVGGKRIAMNYHTFQLVKDHAYEYHIGGQIVSCIPKLVEQLDDIAIAEIDVKVPLPHIWKHVVKNAYAVNGGGFLLYRDPEGCLAQEVQHIKVTPSLLTKNWKHEDVQHGRSFAYQTQTQDGMCGGLLVCKDNGNWCVAGFHAAGAFERGFANDMTRVRPVEQQGVIIATEPCEARFVVSKSDYVKSPVASVVASALEPAPLHGQDYRLDEKCDSLIDRVFDKYSVDTTVSDEPLLKLITAEYAAELVEAVGIHGSTTLHDAITNTESPLDRTASVGSKFKPSKRQDLVDFQKGELRDSFLKNEIARRVDGDWSDVEFDSFIKDELRPREKVKAGKVRCVEACPLDALIANRMLMLKVYIALYKSDPCITGCAPGINVYTEFAPMAQALREYNYCLDFSAYDSRLSEQVMRCGVEVLSALHHNPESVVEAFECFVVSRHRVDDHIKVVRGGMPSGCPATSLLNSICNVIMARYCFAKLGYEQPLVVAYGDDNIISCNSEIDPQPLVDTYLSEFGMVATAADKTSDIVPVSRSDVEFLKRKLIWNEDLGLMVAALPLESMLNRIAWKHRKTSFSDQLRSFYLELAMYGYETYTEVQQVFFPFVTMPNYSTTLSLLRPILGLE